MLRHAASTMCWPILMHFGDGFIGISVGAFVLAGSHQILVLCKIGGLRPPAVFGSGIRTPSPCLGCITPSLPFHPLASTPINDPSPIRLDPPLQQRFFLGPRVRAQVVIVIRVGQLLLGQFTFRVACPKAPVPSPVFLPLCKAP